MRKLFDNGDFEELFRRHPGWDNPPEGLTRVDVGGGNGVGVGSVPVAPRTARAVAEHAG